jgi:hypothetical protein
MRNKTFIWSCVGIALLLPSGLLSSGCGGERRVSGNYTKDFWDNRSGWVPSGEKSIAAIGEGWTESEKDGLVSSLLEWQRRAETPRWDVGLLRDNDTRPAFFTFRKDDIADNPSVLGYADVRTDNLTGDILRVAITLRSSLSGARLAFTRAHEIGHGLGLGHATGTHKYISLMSPVPTLFAPTPAQTKPGEADLDTLEAWYQVGDDLARRNERLGYWSVSNQLSERVTTTRYTLKENGDCDCRGMTK